MPGPILLALSRLLHDEVSSRAYAELTPLINFPGGVVKNHWGLEHAGLGLFDFKI